MSLLKYNLKGRDICVRKVVKSMKYIFESSFYLLLVMVVFSGCVNSEAGDNQNMSEDAAAQVMVEVEAALQAFHTADTSRNAQGVIDLLWPDYSMRADGASIGYEDVVAGSPKFMAGLSLFHTVWSDVEIIPLSHDAAVTSFHFRDSILTKEGVLSQSQGPNTFVWQKRAGEWKVRFGDADHYPIE